MRAVLRKIRPLALTLLASLASMVFLWGCCSTAHDAPLPLAVSILAEPGPATVLSQGKPLGTTPLSARFRSFAEIAQLVATQGSETAMEQRIQIVSPTEFKLLFRFSKDASAVAKRLGLTRILVFDFTDHILFDFAKADLKPESEPVLKLEADVLRDTFPETNVYVCGHTDDIGSPDTNLLLSVKRAEAVAAQLEKLGVERKRMKVTGFGLEFPIAPNDTEPGRAANRRTELVLPR